MTFGGRFLTQSKWRAEWRAAGRTPSRAAIVAALLAAALVFLFAGATPASARDKIALVVGAYDYGDTIEPLVNPEKDAADMAALLKSLGFTIVGGGALQNPTLETLRRAVVALRDAQTEGSLALFYYAGHAVEIDGQNFLVPVGASVRSADDKNVEFLPLSFVTDRLKSSMSARNVVILDACRNNPFRGATRSLVVTNGGLQAIEAIPSMFVAYSTSPNEVAFDGPAGFNSPYTAALLSHLGAPKLPILFAFDSVARQVAEATNGQQIPYQVYNFGVADLRLNDGDLDAATPAFFAAIDDSASRGVEGEGNAAIAIAKTLIRARQEFLPRATTVSAVAAQNGPLRHVIGYGRSRGVVAGDTTTLQAEEMRLARGLTSLNADLDDALGKKAVGALRDQERAGLLAHLFSFDGSADPANAEIVAYLKASAPKKRNRTRIAEIMGQDLEAAVFLDGRPTDTAAIEALKLVRLFEGLSLEPYRDAVGVWTIGYGHTGPEVGEKTRVTAYEALQLLAADLELYRRAVNDLVTVELDSFQSAALISLSHGIGVSAFARSTLLKRLNRRDYIGASEALRWWNRTQINGQLSEVPSLTRRREAEARLFLRNIPPDEIVAYYAARENPELTKSR